MDKVSTKDRMIKISYLLFIIGRENGEKGLNIARSNGGRPGGDQNA